MEIQDDIKPNNHSGVERTISRRSNSGVGSRSEEDVFTDAVTEFSESPAVLARVASSGVMQRFYSMQNDNGFEDTKLAEENFITGEVNLSTTDLLKDNHLQTAQIVVGEKDEMGVATASHAPISANHSLVSPAVIPEIENVIHQNIMESSELSSVLNVVSERGNEIISNKDGPELRNSYTRIPEEVAGDEGKDAKNEHLTSDSLEDKQEQSQKFVHEKKASRELDHTSANSSHADIDIFKSEVVGELKSETSEDRKESSTEEKKPNASTRNVVSLKGTTMEAEEITLNPDSVRSDIEDDGEYFPVMHKNNSKVSEDDEITAQDLGNLLISDINCDENITLDDTILNGIEVSDGAAAEKIEEIKISDKNALVEEGNDHFISTLKKDVDEKAEPSCQSSASVNHCSDENFGDDTCCLTEGDRFIKQRATVSDVETIVDSGSIADSLDGNWGSVSDVTPTADTTALNYPRAFKGEEIPSMVPQPVIENQHSRNKVSEIKQMERDSKLHSSTVQECINSAVQSTSTTATAHLATVPNRGNKGKGIIINDNPPLKELLGEAKARSRAGSPAHHSHNQGSSSTFTAQNDVIPSKNVIYNSDHPEMETVQDEMGKEWNSPARYPVDIKAEKRSKTRAYWVPFLCCSSVNAR